VEDVTVDVDAKTVPLVSTADNESIVARLAEAGYPVS
jgi:hypothetical protein